jgi:membrane protease YdiL (CAAX protease family)
MHIPQSETAARWRSRLTAAAAPWWHAALLVLLLVGVSFLNARRSRHGGMAAHHAAIYGATIVAEWVLLLLTWWGLRMKRIPLGEVLGFRRGARAWAQDLGAGLIFWIAAVIILGIISLLLRLAHLASAQKTVTALAPRNAVEMLLWVLVCLSAGFCEEVVFRGYFLRQFSSPIHRVWLGVLLSSLLFGLSHGYEGAAGMIVIVVYGAMFCALALARDSLRPGMIAHAWHDIITGVALVLLRHAHLP